MKFSALNIGMLSCDVIKKIMMLKVNLANYCKLKVDLAHNDGIYQWLWELNLQNLLVFEKYVITAKTFSDFLINNIKTWLAVYWVDHSIFIESEYSPKKKHYKTYLSYLRLKLN